MNIAGFYSDSISNGVGWRAVLFVSGCTHHCPGCQNPQTWDKNYGTPFHEDEIYDQIMENELLDGLTLSGGDPILYFKELLPLVKRVKANGLNVWSYTGFTYEHLFEWTKREPLLLEFLQNLDVLVDGRFEQDKHIPNLKFRGSTNQRIIDVPRSLLKKTVCLYPME